MLMKAACTLLIFAIIVGGFVGFGFGIFWLMEATQGTIWHWLVMAVLGAPGLAMLLFASYCICDDLRKRRAS